MSLRKARYRFEQTNIIKMGKSPLANTKVRGQYLFQIDQNEILSQWEESHYYLQQEFPEAEDFLSLSDKIRGKIHCRINQNGDVVKILNAEELRQHWEDAKINEIMDSPFISRLLTGTNVDSYNEIIRVNDLEYSDMNIFINSMKAYLYFEVVLGQYLLTQADNLKSELKKLTSQFFPTIEFEVNIAYSQPKITDEHIIIKQSGTIDKSSFNIHEMIHEYDAKYKPQIGYNFSEFLYEYQTTLFINKTDGLLDKASVTIIENIKNNLLNHIDFELERVEL